MTLKLLTKVEFVVGVTPGPTMEEWRLRFKDTIRKRDHIVGRTNKGGLLRHREE